MTDLFLDIETVADFTSDEFFKIKNKVETGQLDQKSQEKDTYWKYQLGALNPYDGKVILITYKIDDGHIFHEKEWEVGEGTILRKFFELLTNLEYRSTPQEHLKIIGQNIRGFDLIFLYERMKHHYPNDSKWFYHHLIKKPEIIDFIQMHVPLNNFQIKGLRHNVLVHAYGFQPKVEPVLNLATHYHMKEYDKILDYSKSKFVYPELYKKIQKEGLVSKSSLQSSIQLLEAEKIVSQP